MEKIHLLITRCGDVWRVRILIPSQPRPRWRAYRVADYPTPEAVVRRCAAGLVTVKPENKPHEGEEGTFAATSGQSMIHLFGFGGSVGGR